MKTLRVAFLFAALFAFGSVASAQCLTCQKLGGMGTQPTCQESSSGGCSGICCYSDVGTPCTQPDWWYPCPNGMAAGAQPAPDFYFTSRLPMQTQGSALRVQLGKGKRALPPRKCGAAA
ncbi:MAG TPA: hypothetical protein VF618_09275 [Thermoanaerobaculia bacterium]